MALPDYYTVLQVTPTADSEVVEAAYKRLAFKHHPDRNRDPGSATKMRELNQAYAILRDSKKRHQYDQELQSDRSLHDLFHKVNHLLDLNYTHNEVIKSLVEAGMELETSARVVGTVVEHRRRNGVAAQPDGKLLAHYKADDGKIMSVYVLSALLVLVGLGLALVPLFGKYVVDPGLEARFLYALLILVPAVLLSWFMVKEAKKHWNEEVIVFANRLQWQMDGNVRSFELTGIKSMTVVAGEGIIEFALGFFSILTPELVIVDNNDKAWRIKAYLDKMDELCQVAPSVWTANSLGLR